MGKIRVTSAGKHDRLVAHLLERFGVAGGDYLRATADVRWVHVGTEKNRLAHI